MKPKRPALCRWSIVPESPLRMRMVMRICTVFTLYRGGAHTILKIPSVRSGRIAIRVVMVFCRFMRVLTVNRSSAWWTIPERRLDMR